MASSARPELFDFHGVSMTHYFTDNWENFQNFHARPDDILIASYPRAGSTWVSYILDQLYFGQTSTGRRKRYIYGRAPNLEVALPPLEPGSDTPFSRALKGTEEADELDTSPRLLKTHVPVQFVPKSIWEQNCRIICVIRNAKDNMVSCFHFDRMTFIQPEPGDWSSYFHRFMEGEMVFGSWCDHVNGWWKKKQTYSNLHTIFYEDIIEDTGREIDKLCCFLGLSLSTEEQEIIWSQSQFDRMQRNEVVSHSKFPGMDFKVSSFLRKGKVGDWKNHFTVAQNEQFDEDYKKQMKDPTLQFRTEV